MSSTEAHPAMLEYLTEGERRILLAAARDGVEAAVEGRSPRRLAGEDEGRLGAPGACFVTLHGDGELRGCIGGLAAHLPLAEHVRAMAESAALRDPRFPPLQPGELPRTRLSLSVLTPVRPLDDIADLRLGRDGLVVSRGFARGVLLPQVAVQHDWSRETFLAHTCRKAGLPPGAWKDPETTVEVFSAEVFAEP